MGSMRYLGVLVAAFCLLAGASVRADSWCTSGVTELELETDTLCLDLVSRLLNVSEAYLRNKFPSDCYERMRFSYRACPENVTVPTMTTFSPTKEYSEILKDFPCEAIGGVGSLRSIDSLTGATSMPVYTKMISSLTYGLNNVNLTEFLSSLLEPMAKNPNFTDFQWWAGVFKGLPADSQLMLQEGGLVEWAVFGICPITFKTADGFWPLNFTQLTNEAIQIGALQKPNPGSNIVGASPPPPSNAPGVTIPGETESTSSVSGVNMSIAGWVFLALGLFVAGGLLGFFGVFGAHTYKKKKASKYDMVDRSAEGASNSPRIGVVPNIDQAPTDSTPGSVAMAESMTDARSTLDRMSSVSESMKSIPLDAASMSGGPTPRCVTPQHGEN